MHYGHNASLSTLTALTVLAPLLLLAVLYACRIPLQKGQCHDHSPGLSTPPSR
ncbi:MAG: hypothetical protein U0903_10715 [Planctomycetales bacterium]